MQSLASTDAILLELNKLRADPKSFIPDLQTMLGQYNQMNHLTVPGHAPIPTAEGSVACQDAINFLQTAEAGQALNLCPGMTQASKDHALDLSNNNKIGHKGADGSDFVDRLEKYGEWEEGDSIEVNMYGENMDARFMISKTLIDDNIKSRNNRKSLLKTAYKNVGIFNQAHPTYKGVCVFTFTEEYTPLEE